MLSGPPRAGGSVLLRACAAALESAAEPPLALPIQHATNRLAASGAAEARRLMNRLQGQFIAPRPVAHGSWQNNFCCVTTRRRNFGLLRCWWRREGALTARTLRRGVLGFGRSVVASSRLPPRRLPAADLPLAFGVLAVTLVPTPRLVLVPTAFAQADPRPRSSRTGTAAAGWSTMMAAHGSVDLPRDSPGGTRSRSPRAFIETGKQRVVRQYTARKERDREGNGCKKAWPGRRATGNQTVIASPYSPEGTRQGRKRLEKGAAKETRKDTSTTPPSTWLSSNTHNWLCFAARSQKTAENRFSASPGHEPASGGGGRCGQYEPRSRDQPPRPASR